MSHAAKECAQSHRLFEINLDPSSYELEAKNEEDRTSPNERTNCENILMKSMKYFRSTSMTGNVIYLKMSCWMIAIPILMSPGKKRKRNKLHSIPLLISIAANSWTTLTEKFSKVQDTKKIILKLVGSGIMITLNVDSAQLLLKITRLEYKNSMHIIILKLPNLFRQFRILEKTLKAKKH